MAGGSGPAHGYGGYKNATLNSKVLERGCIHADQLKATETSNCRARGC
jgi:hypothetical protein